MQCGLGTSAMLCHSNLVGILFVIVDWRFEALLTEQSERSLFVGGTNHSEGIWNVGGRTARTR